MSLKIQLVFFLEFVACTLIFLFNIIYGKLAEYPNEIIYFNGILLFIVFTITAVISVCIIIVVKKENDLIGRLKEFEVLQEYTLKLENLYMEIRTFKHDYLNILSTMQGFFEEKKYDELVTYYHKEILPTGHHLAMADSILGRLSNIKTLELKGLFYTKLIFAMNHSLSVLVDIPESIAAIQMDTVHLVRVVGIFMDNAIEEAMNTEIKSIFLGLLQTDTETIIKISNSCRDIPSLDKIGQPGTSTKPSVHGIGLNNVRTILNQYNTICWKTDFQNQVFTQELHIYRKDG